VVVRCVCGWGGGCTTHSFRRFVGGGWGALSITKKSTSGCYQTVLKSIVVLLLQAVVTAKALDVYLVQFVGSLGCVISRVELS
jgi:hypothetical protein